MVASVSQPNNRAFTPRFLLTDREGLKGKEHAYFQLKDSDRKEAFRSEMLRTLFGNDESQKQEFLRLVKLVEKDGITVVEHFIDKESVGKLVKEYDSMMEREATGKTSIHHYVNLKTQPDFLFNNSYSDLFFHPLLIALMSYLNGGAVIITDARAKDTGPSRTREQDNSLHFDGKPFFDDLKIHISWEKSTGDGPKGQNFVVVPGTNQLYRDARIGKDGSVFSREQDSIVDTQERLDDLLKQQEKVRGKKDVCEIAGTDGPAMSIFNANRLLHQRYRTLEDDYHRSAVILGFKDAHHYKQLGETTIPAQDRYRMAGFLLGDNKNGDAIDKEFLGILSADRGRITAKLAEFSADGAALSLRPISDFRMSGGRFRHWYSDAVNGQTMQQAKAAQGLSIVGCDWSDRAAVIKELTRFMALDKMSNVDLRLYADNSEEVRKPEKAKARETKNQTIKDLVNKYLPANQRSVEAGGAIMPTDDVSKICQYYVRALERLDERIAQQPNPESFRSISQDSKSLKRLFIDMEDQYMNLDNPQRQATASVYLFLMVASNVGQLAQKCQETGIGSITPDSRTHEANCRSLLANYISVLVSIEKGQELDVNSNSRRVG